MKSKISQKNTIKALELVNKLCKECPQSVIGRDRNSGYLKIAFRTKDDGIVFIGTKQKSLEVFE